MFNADRKQLYLNEREIVAPSTIYNVTHIFETTEPFEIRFDRDVCEWSTPEIIQFYKYLDCKSSSRLIVINSSLFIYTNWCINQLLVQDNQNHFGEINTEVIYKCLNMLDFNNSFIDRETLVQIIDQLPNPCDQFLFLALFEGFSGKSYVEISRFQYSYIDQEHKCVNLQTGRTIPVSSKLIKIAKEAKESVIYISLDQYGSKSYDLEEIVSDVEKSVKRSNNFSDENLGRLLNTRYVKCIDFLGISNKMKMKDLRENGRVHLIQELAKEHNITPVEMLEYPYRIEHEKIYGRIPSVKVFLMKYREYLK